LPAFRPSLLLFFFPFFFSAPWPKETVYCFFPALFFLISCLVLHTFSLYTRFLMPSSFSDVFPECNEDQKFHNVWSPPPGHPPRISPLSPLGAPRPWLPIEFFFLCFPPFPFPHIFFDPFSVSFLCPLQGSVFPDFFFFCCNGPLSPAPFPRPSFAEFFLFFCFFFLPLSPG